MDIPFDEYETENTIRIAKIIRHDHGKIQQRTSREAARRRGTAGRLHGKEKKRRSNKARGGKAAR